VKLDRRFAGDPHFQFSLVKSNKKAVAARIPPESALGVDGNKFRSRFSRFKQRRSETGRIVDAPALAQWSMHNLFAEIVDFTLGKEEFNGDVAEGGVAQVSGDVGEAAAAEVDLAVFKDEPGFGLAKDGVDDIAGAKGDKDVVVIVLMELGIGMGGDFNVVGADEGVVDFQVMMRLAGEMGGLGGLGGESGTKV